MNKTLTPPLKSQVGRHSFIGWHRPDHCSPGRAIVSADTEAKAFTKLLDFVA